ncbi:MAG: hypothetical protein CM1200mP20_14940 [Pseudomonadota bacterium]|nr:MAG: hypothetical protein CM1200mP20_14940 [Pseudomonadota bacterium]
MMVSHCAGQTERIKLAPAVLVTPLYDPARLLAEIGMADCLSNGRLALGLGSGYQPYEFDRFHRELDNARPMLGEFIDMLDLAFLEETFEFHGEHYDLPSTHISARPVNGLPQIWIAGDHEYGHRLCARKAMCRFLPAAGWAPTTNARNVNSSPKSYPPKGRDPETMPLPVQRFMGVTKHMKKRLPMSTMPVTRCVWHRL